MSERLICPYCGREQHNRPPDAISGNLWRTTCELCHRRFCYSVTLRRDYEARRDTEADRYQVITYDRDCGADEKLEYQDLKEAKRAAKEYIDGLAPLAWGLHYTGAIVYDLKERLIVSEYGFFPNEAKPTEAL